MLFIATNQFMELVFEIKKNCHSAAQKTIFWNCIYSILHIYLIDSVPRRFFNFCSERFLSLKLPWGTLRDFLSSNKDTNISWNFSKKSNGCSNYNPFKAIFGYFVFIGQVFLFFSTAKLFYSMKTNRRWVTTIEKYTRVPLFLTPTILNNDGYHLLYYTR